jgi:hypothetical protein
MNNYREKISISICTHRTEFVDFTLFMVREITENKRNRRRHTHEEGNAASFLRCTHLGFPEVVGD